MDRVDKIIIDTMRNIGYIKIEKKNMSRNNILDIVSKNANISINNIKKLCEYKKLIDNEYSKMEYEDCIISDDDSLDVIVYKIKGLKLSSNKV
jgi:hypothetical protein